LATSYSYSLRPGGNIAASSNPQTRGITTVWSGLRFERVLGCHKWKNLWAQWI